MGDGLSLGTVDKKYETIYASNSTKKGKVAKDAKKAWKQAGLYDQEAKHLMKRKYLFGLVGKRNGDAIFNQVAVDNRIDQKAAAYSSGTKIFKDKLQAKLDKAGISMPELVDTYYKRAGGESGISYSWKNSEFDNFVNDLNNNEAGVVFSRKEATKIIKQMGGYKEKAIDPAELVVTTAAGAGLGYALGHIARITAVSASTAHAEVTGGINADANATDRGSITTGEKWGGLIAGGTIAFAGDMIKQIGRQERRVADKTVYVDTLDDYKSYLEGANYNKEAQTIMSGIAEFYTDQDGKLDKKAMTQALHTAAGQDSVLNKSEAQAYLARLKGGNISPVKPIEEVKKDEPIDTDIEPECEVVDDTVKVQEEQQKHYNTYNVGPKEYWTGIIQKQFCCDYKTALAITHQIKNELGIKKSDITMPDTINFKDSYFVDGNEVKFCGSNERVQGELLKDEDKHKYKPFYGKFTPEKEKVEKDKYVWKIVCDGEVGYTSNPFDRAEQRDKDKQEYIKSLQQQQQQ